MAIITRRTHRDYRRLLAVGPFREPSTAQTNRLTHPSFSGNPAEGLLNGPADSICGAYMPGDLLHPPEKLIAAWLNVRVWRFAGTFAGKSYDMECPIGRTISRVDTLAAAGTPTLSGTASTRHEVYGPGGARRNVSMSFSFSEEDDAPEDVEELYRVGSLTCSWQVAQCAWRSGWWFQIMAVRAGINVRNYEDDLNLAESEQETKNDAPDVTRGPLLESEPVTPENEEVTWWGHPINLEPTAYTLGDNSGANALADLVWTMEITPVSGENWDQGW
jgi:hypothetical protein